MGAIRLLGAAILKFNRDHGLFLEPGRDYQELIENYDAQLHRYVKGFRGYRRGMARLYLVKLTPAADPSATPPGSTPPPG